MFGLTFLGDILVFIGGFAVCWVFKDQIIKLFLGAKAFADKLDAKAKAIRDAVK
ncbi:hypothetical protein [Bradyrhizobium sp. BRP56]|uniref:hypothetical protein n=1 Tax=Bradyrhizobium sp. BRP56 TaxID=2793819 RepID=UPI001CD654FD|nr:hypothetical protein [Bradyrhizobium sp. BRP56]MCA1400043.1 hypothetical protein [Bradyrhizobium sp. BRP56]